MRPPEPDEMRVVDCGSRYAHTLGKTDGNFLYVQARTWMETSRSGQRIWHMARPHPQRREKPEDIYPSRTVEVATTPPARVVVTPHPRPLGSGRVIPLPATIQCWRCGALRVVERTPLR